MGKCTSRHLFSYAGIKRFGYHPPFWKIAGLAPLVIWNTFFKGQIDDLDCFWRLLPENSEGNTGL